MKKIFISLILGVVLISGCTKINLSSDKPKYYYRIEDPNPLIVRKIFDIDKSCEDSTIYLIHEYETENNLCDPCFSRNFEFLSYNDGELLIKNGPKEIMIHSIIGGLDAGDGTYESGENIIITNLSTSGDVDIRINYVFVEELYLHIDAITIHNDYDEKNPIIKHIHKAELDITEHNSICHVIYSEERNSESKELEGTSMTCDIPMTEIQAHGRSYREIC